ncbi:MAG: R3H domain-containing nucleic acid-binding protein, partial [Coriobacteriia bacterium]|nr:R3H domain-containing nucleic acid-binding protein [Coriobacteriia bacterium]
PTLSDLVGGIEAVTLSDEEARRRGTQKTVLERRAPPTFDVLVEIQQRDRLAVHMDLAQSVDALLRGYPLPPEIRARDAEGRIQIEKAAPALRYRPESGFRIENQSGPRRTIQPAAAPQTSSHPEPVPARPLQTVRVLPYGVAQNRRMQAAKRMGVPAVVVKVSNEANVLVTLRSYYRDRQQTVVDAEHRGMPIYVLRANTVSQMEQFLSDLFNLSEVQTPPGELEGVAQQTQAAIAAVLNGERWVDLPAGPATVRRLQHEMARQSELVSHSYGKEPRRHVRIFRE